MDVLIRPRIVRMLPVRRDAWQHASARNELQAENAGWLHDISAVIPEARRLDYARQWHIEVLPEEATAPILLHQRQSAVLAAEVFGVTDPAILSAVGCHTTLYTPEGVAIRFG